jgi:hypothetical protein
MRRRPLPAKASRRSHSLLGMAFTCVLVPRLGRQDQSDGIFGEGHGRLLHDRRGEVEGGYVRLG